MDILSEEQQRFLQRYINSRGDFYGVVDSLGLDTAHITAWRDASPLFDKEFCKARQYVIDFLKQENYVTALMRLNQTLKTGVQQYTVTQKHKVKKITIEGEEGDSDGEESTYETNRTTKNLGVPGWAIVEALKESNLVKAINTLANEGVIPTAIARKLLQSSDEITTKMRESFDIKDNEYLSEQKAISLIKTAILGGNSES